MPFSFCYNYEDTKPSVKDDIQVPIVSFLEVVFSVFFFFVLLFFGYYDFHLKFYF
jgi:hypothetical protein